MDNERRVPPLGAIELPAPNDTLFKTVASIAASDSSGTGESGSFVDGTWNEYARQYELAAYRLIESSQLGHITIYPAIFLFRHSLELQLKAVLALGIVVEHVVDEKIDARQHASAMLNTHNLRKLTAQCRAVCDRLGLLSNKQFGDAFAAFEALIQELTDVDTESFAFRYPVDKQLNSVAPHSLQVDLPNVMMIMRRMAGLIRLVWLAADRASYDLEGDDDWTDEDEMRHRKDVLGIDEWEAEQETGEY